MWLWIDVVLFFIALLSIAIGFFIKEPCYMLSGLFYFIVMNGYKK